VSSGRKQIDKIIDSQIREGAIFKKLANSRFNKKMHIIYFCLLLTSCNYSNKITDLKTPLLGEYCCKIDSTEEKIKFENSENYTQTFSISNRLKSINRGKYSLDYINHRQGYSLNLYNYVVFTPNAMFNNKKYGGTVSTAFFYDAYEDSTALIIRTSEMKKYNLY
jgi:hypothetical protein